MPPVITEANIMLRSEKCETGGGRTEVWDQVVHLYICSPITLKGGRSLEGGGKSTHA